MYICIGNIGILIQASRASQRMHIYEYIHTYACTYNIISVDNESIAPQKKGLCHSGLLSAPQSPLRLGCLFQLFIITEYCCFTNLFFAYFFFFYFFCFFALSARLLAYCNLTTTTVGRDAWSETEYNSACGNHMFFV